MKFFRNLPLALLLTLSFGAQAATDDFTGSQAALATHDANWHTTSASDNGVGGFELDGSGNVRATGSFIGAAAYYDNGTTGENSISHITILAGTCTTAGIDSASGGKLHWGVRMTATTLGVQAWIRSSTQVVTNIDRIDIYGDGVYVTTINLATPINFDTTTFEGRLQFTSANNLRLITNGETNDYTYATPPTGGFPSIAILNNGQSVDARRISAWSDDASAGAGGLLLRRRRAANDDVFDAPERVAAGF